MSIQAVRLRMVDSEVSITHFFFWSHDSKFNLFQRKNSGRADWVTTLPGHESWCSCSLSSRGSFRCCWWNLSESSIWSRLVLHKHHHVSSVWETRSIQRVVAGIREDCSRGRGQTTLGEGQFWIPLCVETWPDNSILFLHVSGSLCDGSRTGQNVSLF